MHKNVVYYRKNRSFWSIWPKVQLSLTSQLGSSFSSADVDCQNRRHNFWCFGWVVCKRVSHDDLIVFVPPHSEVLNRSSMVDVTLHLVRCPFHHSIYMLCRKDDDFLWILYQNKIK